MKALLPLRSMLRPAAQLTDRELAREARWARSPAPEALLARADAKEAVAAGVAEGNVSGHSGLAAASARGQGAARSRWVIEHTPRVLP